MAKMSRKKPDVLRVAVIGAGAMGRAHCATIVEQVDEMQLTAVVDSQVEVAEEVGKSHDVPAFATVSDLLASGAADAAMVATPHPLHLPVVEECLAGGLHVLCEKPLAETVSAADRMIHAAEQADRTLGVMFQRRFEPVFEAALNFVRDGGLGDVRRTLLTLPDFRSQAYYEANAWRATWSGEGGGVLINQAPHLMDLFILLGGLPQSLRGHAVTSPMHDIEVEDKAEALLHYANGAVGYFYASTTEPKYHETLEIIGSRGSLSYRRGQLECIAYDADVDCISADSDSIWRRPEIKDVTPTVEPVPDNRLQGRLMTNFARHVVFGEPLRCDAESARQSLELSNAITLSSHQDGPVTLPIDRDEYDALLARLRAESRPRKKKVRLDARETDPGLV
ncbi:MAG: Gfo/Idh/MocA family oxidoreductase [Candidatus Pacebacteria bacterium]|nr:Gfo/Idh/MocA family oxidoreductase [Candidatus Paceibacterota bacterium]